MRKLILLAGLFLIAVGLLCWVAPMALVISGDKFFLTFFWWAKSYSVITMLGAG